MEIINSTFEDIGFTFKLFDSAIAYQKKKSYDLWPNFKRELIETEIKEKRHWKIVESNEIICVFSVMYQDPVIWGPEKNQDPAVYLHRIAVNPDHKGKQIMRLIKEWSLKHGKDLNKKFVRMDTWGNNANLRSYYIACGFNYIGQQYLTKVEGIPEHYGGNVLSLFEIDLNDSN